MVSEVPKVLNSSDAFTARNPKFKKLGASILTALLVKCIQQRIYMSAMRILDSSQPSNFLKMDVEFLSLANFSLTEVSNFWVFLMTLGSVDCLFFTLNFPLCLLARETPIPPTITGPLSWGN